MHICRSHSRILQAKHCLKKVGSKKDRSGDDSLLPCMLPQQLRDLFVISSNRDKQEDHIDVKTWKTNPALQISLWMEDIHFYKTLQDRMSF